MDLSNLCKLSADEILKGSFGIEWESLRAYSDGKLSLTPHPGFQCFFSFGRFGQCPSS